MLKEQKKSSKHISPNSLQNPTDPDATYRKKVKKKHIGYTANLIEKFDDNNRMIEGYDLKKNTYSDQKFAKDTIKRLGGNPTGKPVAPFPLFELSSTLFRRILHSSTGKPVVFCPSG